jgi:predicted esterase
VARERVQPVDESDLGFRHQYVAPGTSGPVPTLLLLHGTGGDETSLMELGEAIAPGAAMLSPRGKVLERGAPRFFRRLAEGVLDIPDLKYRTVELANFVRRAADGYGFDASRVIAVGYSNGANIAAAMLLLRPELLRGAVLFRPMFPFQPESTPDLAGRRVLIRSGRADPLIPVAQPEELAALLRQGGAEVTLQWSPGGHNLTYDDVQAAAGWLRQQGLLAGNEIA